MRQAREQLDLGLDAGDVSSAIAGPEGPRLDSAARAVLLAVDDVLDCGRDVESGSRGVGLLHEQRHPER